MGLTRYFWRGLALLTCASIVLAAAASSAFADAPELYGEASTKNVAIPMRDGVVLRADVYYPTNPGGGAATGPFPVLVSETPYGKEAATIDSLNILAGHRPYLVKRGYIQVLVDVRGQGTSGGSFQLLGPAEAADSKEVVNWAASMPNSTGEVGMTGESYLGIVQMFAAAEVGPNSPLKAIFPIVTANDPYRDLLTSGGLLNIESSAALGGVYGVLPIASPLFQTGLDPSVISAYPDFFADHSSDTVNGFTAPTALSIATGGDRAYEGAYWGDKRRPNDVLSRIVANGIPAYLVGGLYDVFQRGEPLNFSGLQNAWAGRPVGAPMEPGQDVTGRYQLLMKPAYHTTVDSGEPNLDELQLDWFDHWLKQKDTGIEDTDTPLHVIEPDGTRLEAAHFPLDEASPRTYYLGANESLTRAKPTASAEDTLAFTGVSLPCDRSTEQWSLGALEILLPLLGLGDPCAGHDVIPASAGPGQLIYNSPPMGADTVLAGPIAATLYATANTTDTEWIAKLSDVAPDGTSTDLTQGALQGSHRALDAAQSWTGADGLPIYPFHPHTKAAKQAVVPGQVTRYDVEIRSMFATLPAGHRLRLTLLSSQSPHLVPIPPDLPNFVGGIYKVQRSATAPSSLQVPLADPAALSGSHCANPALTPHAYLVRGTRRASRRQIRFAGRAYASCRTDDSAAQRTVRRVDFAFARLVGGRCAFLSRKGRLQRARPCSRPTLLAAKGRTAWRVNRAVKIRAGRYAIWARATDGTGTREAPRTKPNSRFRLIVRRRHIHRPR